MSMVEVFEDIIDSNKPYCVGGKSNTNERVYNYIFKYSYTADNKPRKLVIKISNGQFAVGNFKFYIRKGNNINITKKFGLRAFAAFAKIYNKNNT